MVLHKPRAFAAQLTPIQVPQTLALLVRHLPLHSNDNASVSQRFRQPPNRGHHLRAPARKPRQPAPRHSALSPFRAVLSLATRPPRHAHDIRRFSCVTRIQNSPEFIISLQERVRLIDQQRWAHLLYDPEKRRGT